MKKKKAMPLVVGRRYADRPDLGCKAADTERLKADVKAIKARMRSFYESSSDTDIDTNERDRVLGTMYATLQWAKDDLKRVKANDSERK